MASYSPAARNNLLITKVYACGLKKSFLLNLLAARSVNLVMDCHKSHLSLKVKAMLWKCSIFNGVFNEKISNVAGGFKGTGTYPFNPRYIPQFIVKEPENSVTAVNVKKQSQPCETGAADQAQDAKAASVTTLNARILKIPLVV